MERIEQEEYVWKPMMEMQGAVQSPPSLPRQPGPCLERPLWLPDCHLWIPFWVGAWGIGGREDRPGHSLAPFPPDFHASLTPQ